MISFRFCHLTNSFGNKLFPLNAFTKSFSHKINFCDGSLRYLSDKPKNPNVYKALEEDCSIKKNFYKSENEGGSNEFSSNEHFSPDIIYDFDEERDLKEKGLWKEFRKPKLKPDLQINEERGKTGVFDPEELVSFLRSHKAKDVVVIFVPPEVKFVDYLVLATGKSMKHISVLAELTRLAYKKKKNPTDDFIKIEGKATNSNWLALDMGNIALHIMNKETREEKDIESLWTVGAKYDDHCQKDTENPYLLSLLKQYQLDPETSASRIVE